MNNLALIEGLAATSNDPLDEIDSDIRRINAQLTVLAQLDNQHELVQIRHPRALRALQRMPVSDIQRLALSTMSAYTFSANLDALLDTLAPLTLYDEAEDYMQPLTAGAAAIFEILVVFQRIVRATPAQQASLATLKTGLLPSTADALHDTDTYTLRRLARAIDDQSFQTRTPALKTRFSELQLLEDAETARSRITLEIIASPNLEVGS